VVPAEPIGVAGRPSSDDGEGRARRSFAFTITLLGLVLLVTFFSQLLAGAAPDWLRMDQNDRNALWPQGWFFFAHIAHDDVHLLYNVASDGASPTLLTQVQLSSAHLWGLRRTGGAQIAETYNLFQLVPDDGWTPCNESDLTTCWSQVRARPVYHGVNQTQEPRFCGRLLAVVAEPARWGTDGQVAQRVERAAALDIACPG
jgi:hypothetical protein